MSCLRQDDEAIQFAILRISIFPQILVPVPNFCCLASRFVALNARNDVLKTTSLRGVMSIDMATKQSSLKYFTFQYFRKFWCLSPIFAVLLRVFVALNARNDVVSENKKGVSGERARLNTNVNEKLKICDYFFAGAL